MATKQSMADKQYLAKILFTREQLDQKTVAKRVGVSENTISKWVKDYNWKMLRSRLLLSKDEQINSLYEELEEISNAIKEKEPGKRYADTKLADVRIKTTTAIRNLETDLGIAETVDVGIKAIKFAQKTLSHDQILWLTDFWHSFIQNEVKGK